MFLYCIINAKETRDIVTCDIPGAFVQVDMDEMIHLHLTGILATLLTQVDPEKYEKFITYEKGIPVIYLRPKN